MDYKPLDKLQDAVDDALDAGWSPEDVREQVASAIEAHEADS